jgi:translation initiation factor IF-1
MSDRINHELDGVITESLPNSMYRIKLENEDRLILATVSGKMRINKIRVMPGDRVKVEFTPYDPDRGRIIFKYKS